MDNQMGYGIGNDLFDIRYLDDSTKGLLAEGWQQMQDPTDRINKSYSRITQGK